MDLKNKQIIRKNKKKKQEMNKNNPHNVNIPDIEIFTKNNIKNKFTE